MGFWYMGSLTGFLCVVASTRASYYRLTGQWPNESEGRYYDIPFAERTDVYTGQ